MSDRPKWMPRLSPSEWHFEPTFRQTGISAQIAVLEEMNKNLTYKSLGNAITDKLISLRKELENG